MTGMDEKVLSFLKEWLAWAEAGGPEHPAFSRRYGLCGNCQLWDENLSESHIVEGFLRGTFPFGERDYKKRFHTLKQHECPKRLAWVRDKIAELEAKGTEQ